MHKSKLFYKLFIIGSLLMVLLIIFVFIFAIMSQYRGETKKTIFLPDKYFFKQDYQVDDPFITRNPGLRDMLAGPIISAADPATGDARASVVIVEYSDFVCKHCFEQEQLLKKIVSDYKYKVRLIWKDYPELDQDSASYQAAIAGRCAQEQAQFWPYHDFLYEYKDRLNRGTFLEIANLLELNIDNFKNCLESDKVKDLINDNVAEANALDITGIPFIYVNDQEIMGQIDYEDLKKIVEIELGK
ncbi:thioredoxin domain-containing protein [Candidatus Parcubacteria bacterium]|nr:thioredoxin domain-containing protein [Candidatus Parcubacteria bacterium]